MAHRQNVVVRVIVYYLLLGAALYAAWRWLPTTQVLRRESLDALFGGGGAVAPEGIGKSAALRAALGAPLDQATLALTVGLAMISAVLLALPVAWVYTLTRSKRGYQQSVVQTLIVLPLVVAGVVVLVKYSLALAFSLAGIVAAVRFRNTLDDSKDAVYIFLATGVGLAAAVDLPVAFVISLVFNLVILLLWYTDFGRQPAHLEGHTAERKLQRAMEQMSRTGTFVARIDKEVFENMSAEQLQAVADRAWRRMRRNSPEAPDADGRKDVLLRLRTAEVDDLRRVVEPLLEVHVKRWRYGGVIHEDDGTHVVEYGVLLRRTRTPDELLETLRHDGAPYVMDAELN